MMRRTLLVSAIAAVLVPGVIPAFAYDIAPRPRPQTLMAVPDNLIPAESTVRPRARPEGLAKRPNPTLSTKAAPRPDIPDVTPLNEALDAMRDGKWEQAFALAEGAGQVAEDVIEWHWLRAGRGDFDAAVAFLDRNADWPGLKYLRRKTEGRVPLGRRSDDVIAFFGGELPQTGAGSVALSSALSSAGKSDLVEDVVVRAWTSQVLSSRDEAYFLERHGDLLKAHHEARLDYLLWEGEAKAAERMLPRVSKGWQALAKARMALRAKKNGVDGLIAAVPASLKDDPGLAYERFQWRIAKKKRQGARDLLLELEASGANLGQGGRYGHWRRVFTRDAMRAGKAKTAYRLAASHQMTDDDGYAYSDLEWLAGYLSLTYLDKPKQALEHFRAFRASVETPISLGRAGYWEGRAHEAIGDAEGAALAYAFGAEYQTSFYGQLAAERAGLPMDPRLTGETDHPNWRTASFRDSSVLAAGVLLHEAGEPILAERFLTHMAETLTPTEVAQLADFAFELEEPHIALMIAKRAAYRGIVVPHAYYPVVDLGLDRLPIPQELALSIARRESEFDPGVTSPAGAMGLMQVMPGTARDVAKELKIAYSRKRLLSDPSYNARLGVTYLDGLIDRFGANMVLVSAGYNAGPGRPIRWMEDRGDPRTGRIDVIDWIEHIPFRETRNYVMRVMESLPVYRARISGETAPLRMLAELQAR